MIELLITEIFQTKTKMQVNGVVFLLLVSFYVTVSQLNFYLWYSDIYI